MKLNSAGLSPDDTDTASLAFHSRGSASRGFVGLVMVRVELQQPNIASCCYVFASRLHCSAVLLISCVYIPQTWRSFLTFIRSDFYPAAFRAVRLTRLSLTDEQ